MRFDIENPTRTVSHTIPVRSRSLVPADFPSYGAVTETIAEGGMVVVDAPRGGHTLKVVDRATRDAGHRTHTMDCRLVRRADIRAGLDLHEELENNIGDLVVVLDGCNRAHPVVTERLLELVQHPAVQAVVAIRRPA